MDNDINLENKIPKILLSIMGYDLIMAPELTQLDSEQIDGLYGILLVSTRIASDHMKFMRMYSDPVEIVAFNKATELANSIDEIRTELSKLEYLNPYTVLSFIQRTLPLLQGTIELKTLAIEMSQSCKMKLLLPVSVLYHLRREVDFFIGNFDLVIDGRLTKNRDTLGLPGPSEELMSAIPISLIDKISLEEAISANLSWIELFVKHNIEHADLLIITDRAGVERSSIENTLNRYKSNFTSLLNKILDVDFNHPEGITQVQKDSISLAESWKSYLTSLLNNIRSCKLQENFPQRLVEHMIIETNLHEEASMRLLANLSGKPLTVSSLDKVTYNMMTPKEILLS